MSALTLKVAVNLVSEAINAGRGINAAPLTIAVLDTGGHLIALQREDGASLLRAAGLPEGISTTVAEHEALASRLIAHANERQALRQRLREARSRAPLFDTQGFVTGFEAVIERLWQTKLASQSAA